MLPGYNSRRTPALGRSRRRRGGQLPGIFCFCSACHDPRPGRDRSVISGGPPLLVFRVYSQQNEHGDTGPFAQKGGTV